MKRFVLYCISLASALQLVSASITVEQDSETIPERGRVPRFIVAAPIGRFALNPPMNWASQLAGEDALTLRSERAEAAFTLHFTNSVPHNAKDLRDLASKQWPGARIVDESEFFTRDSRGISIECVYKAAGGATFHTHFGVITTPGGGVEFTLTAPDANFARLHSAWVALLNSFHRIEETAGAKPGPLAPPRGERVRVRGARNGKGILPSGDHFLRRPPETIASFQKHALPVSLRRVTRSAHVQLQAALDYNLRALESFRAFRAGAPAYY
jgi:hypothetical protein